MHDHRNATGSTAMRTEDGEEGSVAVFRVLRIVEESCLGPFATADVRLGGKLTIEFSVVVARVATKKSAIPQTTPSQVIFS